MNRDWFPSNGIPRRWLTAAFVFLVTLPWTIRLFVDTGPAHDVDLSDWWKR